MKMTFLGRDLYNNFLGQSSGLPGAEILEL